MPKFGPAGNSLSFSQGGYKTSLDAPKWISSFGLTAYEYQCTHGVKISEAMSNALKIQAERYGISLSIHAPYYINLASTEEKIQESSTRHIISTLKVADWMGANRIVFHPGAVGLQGREEALENAKKLLSKIIEEIHDEDLQHILLCPETMGKNNQLGNLDEVIDLCMIAPEILRPTVDFGHLHALSQGGMKGRDNFARVFAKIAKNLGDEVAKNLHVHFSPIEYTKGGEKKHRTLDDKTFGPDFYYLAEVMVKENLSPTIICESAGTQAEDARSFMSIYRSMMP